MYLKLDGTKIIGHHPGTPEDPENYDVTNAPDIRLTDDNGEYKYDWDGDYVELNQTEIDNHETNIERRANNKFEIIRSLVLTRVALQEVIDHPQVPQAYKNRAQTKLTSVNQELADIIGI